MKDATSGQLVTGALVKVAAGGRIVSGATDFRGVFVAQIGAAPATIIAEAGPGRYAYATVGTPRPERPDVVRTGPVRPRATAADGNPFGDEEPQPQRPAGTRR